MSGLGQGKNVVVATIARRQGETGVHAHARSLLAGLARAGVGAKLVTPFDDSRFWPGVFAFRKLIRPVNRSWSTRWYRHFHRLALLSNLRAAGGSQGAPAAVVAQCPLSASAALQWRHEIGGRFPIMMVCHFNHGEAKEYREQGELPDDQAYRAIEAFEADLIPRVDHVVYVSDWARRVVEVERGLRSRAHSVIHNGIPDIDSPTRLSRADLHVPDDRLVMVNVGTLESRKNQLALVELFALVHAKKSSAHLVLVGEGPDRSAIERRVDELNLAQYVTLLGYRRDVSAILPLADMYVHAARLENCPVALIEAARAGLPVAAPPVGGIPELLQRLDNGVLADLAKPAEALAAVMPLLDDPGMRHELGQRGRQQFLDHFTDLAMTSAYLQALGLVGATAGVA
jgi:glycosyltransferase involved in cell wall biosynthesis